VLDLVAALGLALAVEGILFAAFSDGVRKAMYEAAHTPSDRMRLVGIVSAMDLGGLHSMVSGAIDLDTLGLTAGNDYTLDVFHAERCDSGSNFRIDTSIACFIVPG